MIDSVPGSPSRDGIRAPLPQRWGRPSRSLSAAVVAGLLICLTAGSCAQPEPSGSAYPSRPVKLIVPFSAGGGTDVFARHFKKALDETGALGQPLVIVNVPGAGATVGSRRVKDAVPDGYTLLILHEAILTAKYANTVNYGPEAFEPIAATGEIGMVLAVAADSPIHDLRDLLEQAAAQPETLAFAANLGAPSHFAGLLLEQKHPGAVFRFAQYGGGADRFAAIKGGHVTLSAFSLAEYVAFQPDLRALAFLGPKRHPEIPQIPTAREQGYDLVNRNVLFWWAPKGTPQERIEHVARALREAMQTESLRNTLAELKYEPVFATGPELQTILESLTREIEEVVPRKTIGLPNVERWVLAAIGLVVLVIARQFLQQRPSRTMLRTGDVERRNRSEAISACGFALLIGVYVLVLSQQWLDFAWATVLFVAAAGTLLSARKMRSLPGLAVLAIVLGLGLQQLFTRVFEVDLP